ncbi:hypothetical protein SK128_009810, partial [Halocaridina rubra]
MPCKVSFGEFLLSVVTFTAFVLLIGFTWEAGQSALPPPPIEHPYRRPPIRGHAGLYPRAAPLLDLKEVTYIVNSAVCDNSQNEILLLYLVFSHPSHWELRDAHRRHSSWKTLQELGARRVFLLADGSQISQEGYPAVPMTTVLKESAKYRDVVVGSFRDHYRNLTYKHAMALSWANQFCPNAHYIFKMDDDIMVDIWGIQKLLKSGLVADRSGVIQLLDPQREHKGDKLLDHEGTWAAGLVQMGLRPQRKKSKWKVTRSEFPGHIYPTYLSGWAYLITQPAASAILTAASNNTPFWIDDVYITGVLATKAKVLRFALNPHYTLVTGAASCCIKDSFPKGPVILASSAAPLCNLLVAPSDKNVTLLSSWINAARKCHQGKGCPDQDPESCPPTRPHFGVGT